MADTKIEWTEKTWNPITGCSPVSEGCKNCYAKRMANRLRGRFGYPADDPFRVTFHPDKLEEPLHWKKQRMVFVVSMGDLFHEECRLSWWNDVWDIMSGTPQHTYMILTKRPKQAATQTHWPPNVWLGVSVENNDNRWRIYELLKIPAAVHFISCEPMLEGMLLHWYLKLKKQCYQIGEPTIPPIDWVICGGESGPGRRPFKLEWARDLRDQCRAAGVPFFMKQIDKVRPIPPDLMIREYPGRER